MSSILSTRVLAAVVLFYAGAELQSSFVADAAAIAPTPCGNGQQRMPGAFGGSLVRRSTKAPPKAQIIKLYNLSANPMKQAPAVSGNITTNATGIVEVTYVPALDITAAKLTYTDVTSPVIGFHLHNGNRSTNGPVIVNFCSESPLPSSLTDGSTPCVQQASGVPQWYLGQTWAPTTDAQLEQLLTNPKSARNTYANLHTDSAPNGLIRQQDKLMDSMQLQVQKSPKDTKPAEQHDVIVYDLDAIPLEALPAVTGINSTAKGSAKLYFIPSSGLIVAKVKYTGISDQVIGMHLHLGNDTVNGAPVVVFCGDSPLPAALVNFTVPCVQQTKGQEVTYIGNYASGVDPEEIRAALLNQPQNTYFNVHDLTSFEEVGTNGLIRQQMEMVAEEVQV